MGRSMKRWLALAVCVGASAAWAEAPRNLMVEVRIEQNDSGNNQGVGIGAGYGAVQIIGNNRQVRRSESSQQRLLVMDGGTAMLNVGHTQPLRLRQVLIGPYGKVVSETYVIRSLGGGIHVAPRSRGDEVDVTVSAEEARPVPGNPLVAETLQLSIQVSGRIGEWLMIGDDQRSGTRGDQGVGVNGYGAEVGQSGMESQGVQRVWVRVSPQANMPEMPNFPELK